MVNRLRSWLFVPANRRDRVDKAFAGDADAVIMDLEDACPASEKAVARSVVADVVRRHGGARCYVRINDASTPLALADLEAAVAPGVTGIMLPKAETVGMLQAIDWAIGQLETRHDLAAGTVELMPLVETGTGVVDIAQLARSGIARIRRLTFGAGDLTVDLGMQWTTDEAELAPIRAALVTASRAGGLAAPVDTVWPGISDVEGFGRCLARASAMGFAGKLLIHPNQVAAANATFTPSDAAVFEARRVLAAAAQAEELGQGAFQLDGRLLDHVSVVRARRVLETIGETE